MVNGSLGIARGRNSTDETAPRRDHTPRLRLLRREWAQTRVCVCACVCTGSRANGGEEVSPASAPGTGKKEKESRQASKMKKSSAWTERGNRCDGNGTARTHGYTHTHTLTHTQLRRHARASAPTPHHRLALRLASISPLRAAPSFFFYGRDGLRTRRCRCAGSISAICERPQREGSETRSKWHRQPTCVCGCVCVCLCVVP